MEFIPELHAIDDRVRYYEDGMMGGLEFFKWPQIHDENARWAMAAPGNLDLMFCSVQTFPLLDHKHILPMYADEKAPWFHIRPLNFTISKAFPSMEFGSLDRGTISRLRAAMLEVGVLAIQLQEDLDEARSSVSVSENFEVDKDIQRAQVLRVRLLHAYRKLHDGGQTPLIMMLLFREFQRVLLAMRAWINYYAVIWPRMISREDHSDNVLPLRGVFSNDVEVVGNLHRAGVPVWYIRMLDTFNSSTLVHRSTVPVSARMSFSSLPVMRLGRQPMLTPSWTRKAFESPTVSTLLERIQRVSVSMQSFVTGAQEYNPALASAAAARASSSERSADHVFSFDGAEPGLPVEELARRNEDNRKKLGPEIDDIMRASEDDAGTWQIQHNAEVDMDSPESPSPEHFRLPTYSDDDDDDEGAPTSRIRVDVAGTSAAGGMRQNQKQKVDSSPRAQWVPVEAQGWLGVVKSCGLGDVDRCRLLYFAPPPDIFFSVELQSATGSRRLHNWIRIRRWCLGQAVNSPSHGALWAKTAWRNALDGLYYRVQDIPSDHWQPLSAAADIARLPPHVNAPRSHTRPTHVSPPTDSTSGNLSVESAGGKKKRARKGPKSVERSEQRKRAERVDVNVRLGVHAEFTPWDPAEEVSWGRWKLSQDAVCGNSVLWREVLWELALVNFRLELLHVDRQLCPAVYADPTQALMRSHQVISIWSSEGAVLPVSCTKPVWYRADRI
ncbi:hypothetical protein EUX98_g8568 [Antrodiella citrinella]|uniref:Uncharacterized protein n=1 Tax=Antrodiella citrinella TaxID=2447956 RepID=A0A4S4MBW1_9APHY|nr:hypothetical protein EUX98_g8568 [Antrodiella citrinella]